jgi:hypothetical protein
LAEVKEALKVPSSFCSIFGGLEAPLAGYSNEKEAKKDFLFLSEMTA